MNLHYRTKEAYILVHAIIICCFICLISELKLIDKQAQDMSFKKDIERHQKAMSLKYNREG